MNNQFVNYDRVITYSIKEAKDLNVYIKEMKEFFFSNDLDSLFITQFRSKVDIWIEKQITIKSYGFFNLFPTPQVSDEFYILKIEFKDITKDDFFRNYLFTLNGGDYESVFSYTDTSVAKKSQVTLCFFTGKGNRKVGEIKFYIP